MTFVGEDSEKDWMGIWVKGLPCFHFGRRNVADPHG
jgi:hypothetical protein